MAATSAIEWCDATVNYWWGCTKVGPGCDNCYAEDYNAFRGTGQWGPSTERRVIKGGPALLARLNRQADNFGSVHGRRPRIFMQSMSDTFDNEADQELRARLLDDAAAADRLSIILLTKRISNVFDMIPARWRIEWPRHIGLMVTVVTQREADRDIPRLLKLAQELRIPWVGVSIEPQIERIKLRWLRVGTYSLNAITGTWSHGPGRATTELPASLPGLDWVIVGGESGRNARPVHPAWVADLRDDCRIPDGSKAAFLFKQWGEWLPESDLTDKLRATFQRRRVEKMELHRDNKPFGAVHFDIMTMFRVGKKDAGRSLCGEEHLSFPAELMR